MKTLDPPTLKTGFTPGHTVKSVEWAYPTSSNAAKFGYSKSGCWCVEMGDRGKPLKAVAAFANRTEAIEHAQRFPFGWSYPFLVCNPEFKDGGAR